jgi:hypothetical protein
MRTLIDDPAKSSNVGNLFSVSLRLKVLDLGRLEVFWRYGPKPWKREGKRSTEKTPRETPHSRA